MDQGILKGEPWARLSRPWGTWMGSRGRSTGTSSSTPSRRVNFEAAVESTTIKELGLKAALPKEKTRAESPRAAGHKATGAYAELADPRVRHPARRNAE